MDLIDWLHATYLLPVDCLLPRLHQHLPRCNPITLKLQTARSSEVLLSADNRVSMHKIVHHPSQMMFLLSLSFKTNFRNIIGHLHACDLVFPRLHIHKNL